MHGSVHGAMSADVTDATVAVPVVEASQVGEARRAGVALAERLGFGEADVGRVALAATEAATNLARHATEGVLLVQAARPAGGAGGAPGVDLLAVDRGPGIRDLARASADGFSTGGTAGEGLGAMRRAADLFDVYSVPALGTGLDLAPATAAGAGTVVLARVWPAGVVGGVAAERRRPRGAPAVLAGGVSVPIAGEVVCGDAWAAADTPAGWRVLVADGLGHGPAAAAAAQLAVRLFRADAERAAAGAGGTPLATLMEQLHQALRATRGAAVAMAEVLTPEGRAAEGAGAREVEFVGVGNVAASVVAPDGGARSLVSHNGTVGHQLRRVQAFRAPWPAGAALLLHTDGLKSQTRLDPPALARRHPAVAAAVLWRDYARGRDDATAVVLRDAPESGASESGASESGASEPGPGRGA